MLAEERKSGTNSQRDLEGKVAIVTGAASGIGRATALLLEARGGVVVAEDIEPDVNDLSCDDGEKVAYLRLPPPRDGYNLCLEGASEKFMDLSA